MTMKIMRRLGRPARWAGVAAAATALAVTGAAAPAGGAPASAVTNEGATTAAEHAAVDAYWTPERMQSAVPMEELVLESGKGLLPSVLDVLDGTLGAVAGEIETAAFPHAGGPWSGGGDIVTTTGRVFFTMGGQNASCSGSAVVGDNNSTVITAGHCVRYQGAWHDDWVFVPAYDNGDAPYGTWSAHTTMATPGWVSSEDINVDVGAAIVNPLDGESLTDVVGAQDITFNAPRNPNMYAFGYPAASPYDGTELIYCSGSTFTDFLFSNAHGMSCNMTGGSSGGPWLVDFDEASGTGTLNGVNSFGYIFLPNYMFSPYFGDAAEDLYNEAQGS